MEGLLASNATVEVTHRAGVNPAQVNTSYSHKPAGMHMHGLWGEEVEIICQTVLHGTWERAS